MEITLLYWRRTWVDETTSDVHVRCV